jgi:DNA-binding transcriptional LysR family regulator
MSGTIDRLGILPVFVEVVRQGSFTAAAAQLGLPKSTVSRRIAHLERELGVELLARTTRKIRLTDAGADLYRDVEPALARLEDATRALTDRQHTPRGLLRVTAPTDLADDFVAGVVASFVRRYPTVHVEMVLTNRIVDLVGEGFDVALRAGRLADRAGIIARRLSASDLGLFASASYLERRGVPERVADLAQHDCVLFRAQGGTARWTLEGPEGRVRIDVKGPVTAHDYAFVRATIRAGAGIGLIPMTGHGADPSLVRVLPDYGIAGGALYVVYPSTRHLSAKVAAFRDHVVEEFRSAPWGSLTVGATSPQ